MCVPIWCGWRERLMSIRYGKHGLQCLIRQILPEGFVWFFPNSIYPTHNRHVRGGRSASTPVHWGDALMIGKQLSQSCTSVCCKTDVLSPDKICICFQVARPHTFRLAFFVLWGIQFSHILPWIPVLYHHATRNLLTRHGQAKHNGGNLETDPHYVRPTFCQQDVRLFYDCMSVSIGKVFQDCAKF